MHQMIPHTWGHRGKIGGKNLKLNPPGPKQSTLTHVHGFPADAPDDINVKKCIGGLITIGGSVVYIYKRSNLNLNKSNLEPQG